MNTNYDEAAKIVQINEALLCLGIKFTKNELKYFPEVISDLCLCMGIANDVVEFKISNDFFENSYKRMKLAGAILNSESMTAQERKYLDEYISSTFIELKIAHDKGLNRIKDAVDSCTKKINSDQPMNDTLIDFARIMYDPITLKEDKKDNNKVKTMN